MKSNLLKKFLSFSIGGYINIVLGLAIVPITTRLLSPQQYGIASLVNNITSFLFILSCLGMEQGFVRFFFEVEKEDRGKLLYNSLYFPFFTSIFVYCLIFLFRKKISIFILGYYVPSICLVLVLMVFFRSIYTFNLLIVRMKEEGLFYSFFIVLIKILEFLFIVLLYQFYGNDYRTLLLATLSSLGFLVILMTIKEREIWKFKGKNIVSKRELVKFGAPLTLTMALNWFLGSSDTIMIKKFSTIIEVGIYSGAFKIVSLLSVIQTGFTNFWTPTAYNHYKLNPKDLVFYENINEKVSFIFFSFAIFFLLFRDFILVILGKNYEKSLYVVPMLVFIPVMYLVSETTMLGIGFKKKTKYFLYISIIISCFNIFGNLILVPRLQAKGAAIATGMSYILFFTMRTYFSLKLIKFKFSLKKIYISVIFLFLYALYLTFCRSSLYSFFIGIIVECIIIYMYRETFFWLLSWVKVFKIRRK